MGAAAAAAAAATPAPADDAESAATLALKDEVAASNAEVQKLTAEMQELMAEQEKLKAELQAIKDNEQQHAAVVEEVAQEVAAEIADEATEQVAAAVSEAEAELAALKVAMLEVQEMNEKLTAENATKTDEMTQLAEWARDNQESNSIQIEELKAQLAGKAEKAVPIGEDLSQQQSTNDAEAAELAGNLDSLKAEVSNKQEEKNRLELEIAERAANLDELIKLHSSELVKLEDKLETKEKNLQEMNGEMHVIVTEMQDLNKDLDHLKVES